jgi:hypothetical protein
MACNLSLYFGSSFSNKSFQKLFPRSISNSLDFGSKTYMMAFPQYVEIATEQIEVLIFSRSIEALTIEVATKAPTTKIVAEPSNNRSGNKRKNYTRRSTIIKAINHTSISRIQYNINKAIMVSINRNSQPTKNYHGGKTHINNIIFSNMKTL